MNRMGRRAALLFLAGAAALAGCGGASGAGPVDATAADNRAADQRLQGSWKILDFRPETPLDPVMASMLAFYQPTMVVQVGGGRIRALTTAPGVHFDRRYEVRDALGDRFQLVVWDDAGIAQTSYCAFQPEGTLRCRTTTPWRGDALLARVVPPG
jgi:hypothetical protein